MAHRERKIFAGDPACVGIILLVVLWLVLSLPTPSFPPALAEVAPAVLNYRGR
ncbi:MAG: hypothetical protein M3511_01945 [Deinococcota bacterium]|jgi:hypothetical protein|nr:hypothetical protein [Deinococcota bacterium]